MRCRKKITLPRDLLTKRERELADHYRDIYPWMTAGPAPAPTDRAAALEVLARAERGRRAGRRPFLHPTDPGEPEATAETIAERLR